MNTSSLEGITEMIITKSLNDNFVTTVDERDKQILERYNWKVRLFPLKNRKLYYVIAWDSKLNKNVYLHRVITGAQNNEEVDHLNGNGLDNRRSNLRVGSHRQNQINRRKRGSSKYPGVYFEKSKKMWRARARVNGKNKCFGYFKNENEAFKAYLKGIYDLTGEKLVLVKE